MRFHEDRSASPGFRRHDSTHGDSMSVLPVAAGGDNRRCGVVVHLLALRRRVVRSGTRVDKRRRGDNAVGRTSASELEAERIRPAVIVLGESRRRLAVVVVEEPDSEIPVPRKVEVQIEPIGQPEPIGNRQARIVT